MEQEPDERHPKRVCPARQETAAGDLLATRNKNPRTGAALPLTASRLPVVGVIGVLALALGDFIRLFYEACETKVSHKSPSYGFDTR